MELSNFNTKKFLMFSQKKNKKHLIFLEAETLKKFFIFQETELFYISRGTFKAPKTIFFIFLQKKL